jgi:hypothetical protein
LVKLFKDSINDIADDDGWAFVGELGNLIISNLILTRVFTDSKTSTFSESNKGN